MKDKEKFIQNCLIAYNQIMDAFDKNKHRGYTQVYASIGEHMEGDVGFQIQLMFNTDKEAYVDPHTVGFCVAHTTWSGFEQADAQN